MQSLVTRGAASLYRMSFGQAHSPCASLLIRARRRFFECVDAGGRTRKSVIGVPSRSGFGRCDFWGPATAVSVDLEYRRRHILQQWRDSHTEIYHGRAIVHAERRSVVDRVIRQVLCRTQTKTHYTERTRYAQHSMNNVVLSEKYYYLCVRRKCYYTITYKADTYTGC